MTAEQQRLRVNASHRIPLELWGPYLSERQWGTVREDYGPHGDAWGYLPFDQAAYRAYRWGEDGIAGICDYFQNLCFAFSFWNGKDPILKERFFGLGNYEGNHGEDVKELYYYLDNLPTHYYMQMRYKYPQVAFPYDTLRSENRNRGRLEPEYELLDTGVFDDGAYWDCTITYAKHSKKDIAIRLDLTNHGSAPATISVLPTLWFFNRWQVQKGGASKKQKPQLSLTDAGAIRATHPRMGEYYLYFRQPEAVLFTENETNMARVKGEKQTDPFTKDAFHRAVVEGKHFKELATRKQGTKAAPLFRITVGAGKTHQLYLRLSHSALDMPFAPGYEKIFDKRRREADDFYNNIIPYHFSEEHRNIQRQAYAGLLWSKQFYYYDVERWMTESDGISKPGPERKKGRNKDWPHLKNQDIVLMPDKWEYPWYAAWDLAFHCVAMASVDTVFAKHQLLLLMREWYMKPDGQLPAYEWNFSDVNPPVQSFAALQIFEIEKRMTGRGDIDFLKKVFQKLIVNFTWWINRKDRNGNNMFEGGFLGLDNIGVFNRSIQLHSEMDLDQADGTSWMGMYALNLMDMAILIAQEDTAFEDSATRYFEHFVLIAEALNELHLWNEEDKFFYDTLCRADGEPIQLKIQSVVGLTPLFAISVIGKKVFDRLPDFKKRITWFEQYRKVNGKFWPNEEHAQDNTILMSLVPKDKLQALLVRMLDETAFLSTGGIRALSKYHKNNPYSVELEGKRYTIQYEPGDSTSDMFGGNSNWRGPVWMPLNFVLIRSLYTFGQFYGNSISLEYPTGSGQHHTITQVAQALAQRVVSLFEPDDKGKRKAHGIYQWFYDRPENQQLLLFYEYFHGDTGHGLGASHQTGWTALVAELLNGLASPSGPTKEVVDEGGFHPEDF